MKKSHHRGMEKWIPFDSLTPFKEKIEEEKRKKKKKECILSEDQISEINQTLLSYHNQIITIEYLKNNEFCQINGRISQINIQEQYLKINSEKILFSEIKNIF